MNVSQEKITAELWRRGDTSYRLHAGQLKINDAFEAADSMLFAAECSRQFGKTSWGVWLADSVARANPGCQIRIATAFHVDLASFILPAFRWLFQDCPDSLRPKFLEQKGKYVYANGAEIQLVGLDRNPDKLRGNRLRLILIEEAGFSDSETLLYVFESVIVPATLHEPDARVVLISTPPPTGDDHSFCQLADQANLKGGYIKLTIYDNPLLTPARIEQIAKELGGVEAIAFRREYLCERIIDSERAIIPEFSLSTHVRDTPRPEYFNYLHTYVFMDTGVRDKTVLWFGYYDFPRATAVLEDEMVLWGQQVTTRNIREGCAAKELERNYIPYRRISDNDNLILINDLASEGMHFSPTAKDSLEAMVNNMRLWFKDSRIEIHPRCKFGIGTLRSGVWNKHRDDFNRSTTYGHCDAIAALMYGIRNIDVHTDPVPSKITNPWHKPKGREISQSGKDLAAVFSRKGTKNEPRK